MNFFTQLSARPLLRAARLAALGSLVLAPGLQGEDAPKPPTGKVRLTSGRVAEYTIHFDRNSLRDSVRIGDGLIALTSSGTLIRFELELPAVRWVRERIGLEKVTCLGRGEGDALLAGLSDGRICRVDPATLDLTDEAKLPASPMWIGWGRAQGKRPAGLVAVTPPTPIVRRGGNGGDAPCTAVHDLATGKSYALGDEVTTHLLDRAGRVWLGADKGEWGGQVTRVDLIKGTVESLKPPPSRNPESEAAWEGVYGFIELRDGQVWSYGGTSHMGYNTGEITRIDGAAPQTLFAFSPDAHKPKPNPALPRMPITHVVEEDDGLLVISYSDVFRVDRALKTWKKVATLDLAYRWGRPNAVGAYPSVCAVHPPRRAGEPYLFATVGDGVVVLEGAKATSHAIPGQLGAARVHRVANSSEGTLFFAGDDRLPTWRLGTKGWEIASFAPPLEPDPANRSAKFERDDQAWYETQVLVGPDKAIYTVNGARVSPGTRTTARWDGRRAVRLGRETSMLDPDNSFITADGTLWNASYEGLRRFRTGRWQLAENQPKVERLSGLIKPLDTTNSPPWLLLDRYRKALWQLDLTAAGENPRSKLLEVKQGGKTLEVDDAIPWSDGTILLATRAGLRVYAPTTQTLARADLPDPPRPATKLVRDGLKRLWIGNGMGFWLAEPGAKAPESFDQVPWISQGSVEALVPDPQRADGVIVALGARGIAFVRAGQKP